MRFFSALLVLTTTVVIYNQSEAAPVRNIVPQGLPSFTSRWQKFSIWLPVEPRVEYTVRKRKSGAKMPVYSLVGNKNSVFYLVMAYAHLPGANKNQLQLDLNGYQKSIERNRSRKILRVQDVRQGRYSGREIDWNLENGTRLIRTRLYSTPSCFYAIRAGGRQADMLKHTAEIERVFDSFRILDGEAQDSTQDIVGELAFIAAQQTKEKMTKAMSFHARSLVWNWTQRREERVFSW